MCKLLFGQAEMLGGPAQKRKDNLFELEHGYQPDRREHESKIMQEVSRLPSAYRPVAYKRRKNIWYHRQEKEATQDPEISTNQNQWGTRNWSVAERVNRYGGIKQTGLFDSDGTITQPYASTGQELPDRQTKWEARAQQPRVANHWMPRLVRKNELEGRYLTSDHTFQKPASRTAGEHTIKRKVVQDRPGHDQRTGAIYFPVDPRPEQANMRLAKNRALENRAPMIFVADYTKDLLPHIEVDDSRLRRMETLTPQAPLLFPGVFQPNLNDRDDPLAHSRIFELNRKFEAHSKPSKTFPQKPWETSGYNTRVADVHVTHNKLPTTVLHEKQYETVPISYGYMKGREVDDSKGGPKIQDVEPPKFLFGTSRFDPALARNPPSGFRMSQLPISGSQGLDE
jgi:hypothetical protein